MREGRVLALVTLVGVGHWGWVPGGVGGVAGGDEGRGGRGRRRRERVRGEVVREGVLVRVWVVVVVVVVVLLLLGRVDSHEARRVQSYAALQLHGLVLHLLAATVVERSKR